jgi:hypothetical protein
VINSDSDVLTKACPAGLFSVRRPRVTAGTSCYIPSAPLHLCSMSKKKPNILGLMSGYNAWKVVNSGRRAPRMGAINFFSSQFTVGNSGKLLICNLYV